MCQERVLRLLERENRWRSVKYISKKLNLSRSVVNTNLQKLMEQKNLIRVKIKRIGDEWLNEYWYRVPEQEVLQLVH